jgi:hypothetical protein
MDIPGLTTMVGTRVLNYLGLLDLCYTVPVGVKRKDYRGIVFS